MSKVGKIVQFNNITSDQLYNTSLSTIKSMGAEDIKEGVTPEGNYKWISAVVPSIWGWGGMKIGVTIIPSNQNTQVSIEGYIAQLATSPLNKVMDNFIQGLSNQFKQKPLEAAPTADQPTIQGAPPVVENKDTLMILIALLVSLATVAVGTLFTRNAYISLTIGLVLFLGYTFGKKIFYKK